MKLLRAVLFVSLCVLGSWIYLSTHERVEAAESTTVQVVLSGGSVSIASTWSFTFGTYTVSATTQTVTGAFTDPFTVDDLKGANSGYYTTLQLSGNLVGSNGGTISATNVSTRVASTTVTVVTWTSNPRVVVANGLTSYSSLDTARTFIKRDAATNFGVVGKYGSIPQLQVTIPGYTAAGTYVGTLVYTLYEN